MYFYYLIDIYGSINSLTILLHCRNNFLPSLLHLPSSKLNDGEPRLNKAPNKKQHCDKRDEKHHKTDEDEEDNGDEDDDDLLKGMINQQCLVNLKFTYIGNKL